jgi:hypothetical protein
MTFYTTGSGLIELDITESDARIGSHAGQCDEDIDYLLTLDYIKKQLADIPADLLVDELREYGAWDETELSDHEQNKARLLWIACGDILDQAKEAQ